MKYFTSTAIICSSWDTLANLPCTTELNPHSCLQQAQFLLILPGNSLLRTPGGFIADLFSGFVSALLGTVCNLGRTRECLTQEVIFKWQWRRKKGCLYFCLLFLLVESGSAGSVLLAR